MSKPDQKTIENDHYKRQLHLLEFYLKGRINQLTAIGKKSPAEEPACNMSVGELRIVLDNILPQIREV